MHTSENYIRVLETDPEGFLYLLLSRPSSNIKMSLLGTTPKGLEAIRFDFDETWKLPAEAWIAQFKAGFHCK